MVSFPPFRIDVDDERLWKGAKLVTLRRKPFAILRYLVANPGRLVTHDELLQHVWGGAVVSESAMRTHLHELRQVLGEGVIETVIGRGYRFTAAVVDADGPGPTAAQAAVEPPADRVIVGRAAELASLRGRFELAAAGQRQICFVTGEPGIGKTTLADAFLDQLPPDAIVARGHNIEQHRAAESYLAIIEIFGRLRHSEHGARVLAALARHAPTFLAQVPHLVPDEQLDEIVRRARGGNETRMVRELIEAIETLSAQHTIVLVLEDLQWSDVATIDLLAQLGARRERARLMVIVTARRGEVQAVSHPVNPVMRSLIARSGALLLVLDRFAIEDLARLVALRFPDHRFPDGLVRTLDRITAGTPLFVVSILDDLVGRGMIACTDHGWSLTATIDEVAAHRPESVKQLIDIQLDRLESTEQRVLEAASIIGAEFSTGLVAAALEIQVEAVDELCDALVRRALFLRRDGSELSPDGSLHTRYGVTHALVQEVCLARTAPTRRQRWHRLIAEHLERGYGDRCGEVAHALATHFEHGQSVPRAVQYYVVAGDRTARRFASRDALVLYQRGLELLQRMPETRERDTHELALLGGAVASTLRIGNPSGREPREHLERMIVLARRLDDSPRLCAALLNLAFLHQLVAGHRRGAAICGEIDDVIQTSSLHPALVSFAGAMRALNRFWLGQLGDVVATLASLADDEDTLYQPSLDILGPTDRRTVLLVYLAMSRWLVGEPDVAFRDAERASAHARAINDPYCICLASCSEAWLRVMRGDPDADVQALIAGVLAVPTAALWHPWATILGAWSQPIDDASAAQLTRDFAARVGNLPLGSTLLAVAVIGGLRKSGHAARARELANQAIAFARHHDERVVESELVRLRGELLEPTEPSAAADAYREAVALARASGAVTLERRAADRLAAL